MTDPFATLKPLTHTAEVRYQASNQSLELWRQANIALPDLYVIDRADTKPPPCLGEDGQEMTFERRQQLMAGKKPMFEAADPNDMTTAKFTRAEYTHAFDNDIQPEKLGESAIKNRPKGLRIFKPQVATPVTDMPILYVMEEP
jgi:hypothetical protein